MLVLSRRIGESVCIGDDIVISVARIKGGNVRLAIQAPEDVLVDRREVRQRRQVFQTTDVAAEPEFCMKKTVHFIQEGT